MREAEAKTTANGPRATCRRRRAFLPFFILALAVSLAGRGTARGDAIVRADGRRVEDIRITSARWDAVQYTQNGQPRSFKGDDVAAIERDSDLLRQARSLFERGDFEAARKLFERYEDRAPTEWEKAESAYHEGLCHLRSGDPKKAATAFEDYLAAHRESKDWWVPRAIAGLGRCALAQRQSELAEKRFRELESFGDRWKHRANIGVARALLIGGKPVEARTALAEVLRSRAPDSVKQEALVVRAEVFLAQGQHANAIKELEDGFFSDRVARTGRIRYNQARARATLLMGKAYRAQGGKQNLEQAEIWFLKVAALYGRYREEFQEAASNLAEVYAELGRNDRAARWRSRAAPTGAGGNGGSGGDGSGVRNNTD